MSRTRQKPAFTLVEILVVLIILGIAAAMIVPQMGSRDDLRAAAAARMVMADLIYAQNRAIATQQRHLVIFDTTSTPKTYILKRATQVTPSVILADVQHPITKDSNYDVQFGVKNTPMEHVTLGTVSIEGYKAVAFNELGVPSFYDATNGTTPFTDLSTANGSTIEVTCGKFTLTVKVQPYTGEITVD
jgi:prepilin-type N-terminal cleavage/methylation domain-containing protein